MRKIILNVLSTLIITTSTQAATHAPNDYPQGCVVMGYGFQNHFLILNDTGQQTLFFMHNQSQHKVSLEHIESQDIFMSPKLETQLAPQNWAAFASDIANLNFQCFTTINEVKTPINCADVLGVCQYPRVKFALSNMGNYWVSTNKAREQVVKDTTAKGIYLRW